MWNTEIRWLVKVINLHWKAGNTKQWNIKQWASPVWLGLPAANIYIYNFIIFPSLNHAEIFVSIPDEPRSTSSLAVGQITRAVINTYYEVKCLLLWAFWIYNVSWRILERVFVGNIVNIRNEWLFQGSWGINQRTEQTNCLRSGSRNLFVLRSDSFPWTQKKRHSFLKQC